MAEVREAIREYIAKEFLAERPDVDLDDELSLINEGILDSLGIFLMIDFLQAEFEVEIQPEDVDLANFETVGTISDLVVSKRSAK